MTAPRINLEAMCLLCMTEEEVVLFSLRAGQVPPRFEISNPVINKIRKLFNITVLQDGMPDKICHNCLIKVDTFYNFNTVVEAGQYKLMILTRNVNKSNDAENPEGGKVVDNPVLPFSKFKKYGLMRQIEHARAELPSSGTETVDKPNGTDSGVITVTRPKVPDMVKVRLKPYSIPHAQPDVPVSTPAPKLKSVSLKMNDLMLLKMCPTGTTVSATAQSLPQQTKNRFITKLFPNHATTRATQVDLTPVPSKTPVLPTWGKTTPECPQPSGSQTVGPVTLCMTDTDVEVGRLAVKQEVCPTQEQFECDVCSDTFHLRRPLLRHILTHYQDNIYTCHMPDRDCEAKVWFSSSEFREHLVSKHHKQQDNYVVMALSQRLERNSKAEVCFICMASIKGVEALQQHMETTHKGYFCCTVCRKWFLSARALHIHSALHEGGELE